LGILACRVALVRQMPGRIVGETHDARGMRGFVNTLQTREQHIRREKATSNICTNEAIAAITAAVYLGLMGPEGLSGAGRLGVAKAHALAHRLGALPGCSVSTDGDFFDRFALRVPRLAPGREGSGYALRNALLVDNVIVEATAAHYGDRDDLIIQCTEMTTDAEMEAGAARSTGAQRATGGSAFHAPRAAELCGRHGDVPTRLLHDEVQPKDQRPRRVALRGPPSEAAAEHGPGRFDAARGARGNAREAHRDGRGHPAARRRRAGGVHRDPHVQGLPPKAR